MQGPEKIQLVCIKALGWNGKGEMFSNVYNTLKLTEQYIVFELHIIGSSLSGGYCYFYS